MVTSFLFPTSLPLQLAFLPRMALLRMVLPDPPHPLHLLVPSVLGNSSLKTPSTPTTGSEMERSRVRATPASASMALTPCVTIACPSSRTMPITTLSRVSSTFPSMPTSARLRHLPPPPLLLPPSRPSPHNHTRSRILVRVEVIHHGPPVYAPPANRPPSPSSHSPSAWSTTSSLQILQLSIASCTPGA
jgi:hypothetical protein